MTKLVGWLLAIGLIATACASGDDSSSATAATIGESSAAADYRETLGAATGLMLVEAARSTNPVDVAFLAGGREAGLDAATESLTGLLGTFDEQLAVIEGLEPPPEDATDHEFLLTALGDIRAAVVAQRTAAEERDLEAFLQAGVEIEDLQATTQLEVSPDLAPLGASVAALEAGIGELSDDEADYLIGVVLAQDEFATRSRAFVQSITRQYGSTDEMLEALLDAGAGEAFIAYRDAAADLDPPARFAEDHELLMDYLDGVVAIDAEIAAAAEAGDVTAFFFENEALRHVGVAFNAEVSDPVRIALAGPGLRPPPSDPPGGDTGLELFTILSTFEQGFGGRQGAYAFFGPLTDEQRADVAAAIAPALTDTAEETLAALQDLEIDDSLGADVELLGTHFESVVAIQADIEAAAASGDWAGIQAGTERLLGAWCETGSALSPGAAPIAVAHFAGATIDPACASSAG